MKLKSSLFLKKKKIGIICEMECWGFDMVTREYLGSLWISRRRLWFVFRVVFGLWFGFVLLTPVAGLRPIRERARSWGDEVRTS